MSRCVVLALAAILMLALAAIGGFYMLVFNMPGASFRGTPPPADAELIDLRARLRNHVRVLAHRIGERNAWKPEQMRTAAAYIEQAFRDLGYAPRRHAVATGAGIFHNLEVRIPGDRRGQDILVVGAHYDTVRGSPGADDNASGVAVVLELARLLREADLNRSIHLVAFANEEDPFFATDAMGSLSYARRARADGDNILGMISLEMLGYYTDAPSSQRYPPLVGYFYPERGNFLAFVGNFTSRQLVYDVIERFRAYATVPSEGLAAPERLADIQRSDHWAFWRMGYPAMMLTDTANFRNPNYHRPGDTADTLDYDTMARVTRALASAVRAMASE